MNKTINDQLQNVGFYQGNLINLFNPQNFKKLKTIFDKVQLQNFNCACHTGWDKDWSHDESFDKLNELKNKLVNTEQVGYTIWQYWFFQSARNILDEEEFNFLLNVYLDIAKLGYEDKLIENNNRSIEITLFNKDCFIGPHEDGINKLKLCNILIYTNEDYKEGKGGELVIDDNTILPQFGNFVILDFYYKNPTHKVNKVLVEDFNRIAFLSSFGVKSVL